MVSPPSWKKEIVGGLTTFFTMSYIVFVNPAILSADGAGVPFSGALTATVLVCFTMTLLMGLYARLPYGVAPGMGINAFFTFTLVLGKGVPWPVALGIVFWAGVLFVAVSATPLRERVAEAIPHDLRVSVAAGIGLFLTFIGLKNGGFIVADPATFVKLGPLGAEPLLAIAGFAVMTALLHRDNPFAFLSGIFAVTAGAWALGRVHLPERLFSAPDFSSAFLRLDVLGALKPALLAPIVSLFFTDLFDSISTFIGVSQATGMVDRDGRPERLREGLIVDAFATLGAGLFGSSSGTAYIESAAGIEAGGRTGWTAVVTALLFLPCLFLAPLASVIPPYATAPVLILVGALMFKSVARLELKRLEDTVPPFLVIVLIPLTFSITQGILWGFISHAGLYVLAGRRREVSRELYALAAVSLLLLALENL